jgi:PadR family transcriptional regulator PadR
MKGGLFSVVVLYVISDTKGPIHGYLITKSLQEMAGKSLYIQAGTLYPILKNLEAHGLIRHEMVKSTEGPPKKIYHLTKDGKTALDRLLPEMDDLFNAIGKVRHADWSKIVKEATKE